MEIRISRYCLPFREPHQDGVYYIPRDYYFEMLDGDFSAHVNHYLTTLPAFRKLRTLHIPEAVEPVQITDRDYFLLSKFPTQPLTNEEEDFLTELFMESGIKAAGRRVGRCS